MYRVCNIKKDELEIFLKEGKTTREIGEILGVAADSVSRYVREYGLDYLYDKPKYPPFHLDKVDTKEIAYLLGFIIADGSVNHEKVEIALGMKDIELGNFFAGLLGTVIRKNFFTDKKIRRFPRVRICRKIIGISKYIGGQAKKDRNVPILSKELEHYMVQGIFDAKGSITWGRRKDRNRIWHKVSFTSSEKILLSLQKILYKIGISTMVRPKDKENCFVLDFANKQDVLKFYDYVYSDKSFVPMKRKFERYNALRLELGGFSGRAESTILSCAIDRSVESAETTGELNGTLNDQSSTQDFYNNVEVKI